MKKISIILAIVFLVSLFAFPTSAGSVTKEVKFSNSGSFENTWEKYKDYYFTDGEFCARLVYGYYKGVTKRDYANSRGVNNSTQSSLQRVNVDVNYHYGEKEPSGKWSTCKVSHSAYVLRYRITVFGVGTLK